MKYYLCSGNRTGIKNPAEWKFIEISEGQDVRKIEHLPDAEIVFATPPCSSFTDLPWRKATNKDLDILLACYRLCQEGKSWLLECNRWAQKFIGKAMCHRSGHYFWGNILVPQFTHIKGNTSGKYPLKRAALPPLL